MLRLTLAGTFQLWCSRLGMEDVTHEEVVCWVATRNASGMDDLMDRIVQLTYGLEDMPHLSPLQVQSILNKWESRGHLLPALRVDTLRDGAATQ